MKTIYSFAKHCMNDLEFNCGGIPTKEKEYIKLLDLSEEDLSRFYDAMCILRELKIKYEKE